MTECNCFSTFKNWIPPTDKEIVSIQSQCMKNTGWGMDEFYKIIGIGRTMWYELSDSSKKQNPIPYKLWGVLVFFATGDVIFTEDKKPLVPQNKKIWAEIKRKYIYTNQSYITVPETIVSAFFGKRKLNENRDLIDFISISGLEADGFAALLGVARASVFRCANLKYTDWLIRLIVFGVPAEQLYKKGNKISAPQEISESSVRNASAKNNIVRTHTIKSKVFNREFVFYQVEGLNKIFLKRDKESDKWKVKNKHEYDMLITRIGKYNESGVTGEEFISCGFKADSSKFTEKCRKWYLRYYRVWGDLV